MVKISKTSKLFKNVPLTVILVVPFAIQICVATGAVGLFTFRHGQQTVSNIASSLSDEIGDRISTELNSLLANTNQTNIDVSPFLRSLKYSQKGRVFVIERSGLLVGTSTSEKSFVLVEGKPQRLNISASKDSLSQLTAEYLLKKYGKFNAIQGNAHLEAVFGGEDHFIHVQNWRNSDGLDWLIVIVMPMSRFTGSQDQTQTMILLSYAVFAIAILIGMLTARSISSHIRKLSQSNQKLELRVQVRTHELNASKASLQRINFLLNRRENQLRKQQDILFSLTKDKSINQGNFIDAVQNITRTGSHALNVERVSIWLFDINKTMLHCLDLYLKSTNTHTEADFLTAQDYPQFFEMLQSRHSIAVEEVQTEKSLQELIKPYFKPAGIVSVLIKTFESDGQITGLIAFEHIQAERLWLSEDISFASSLADLLSLGIESQERQRAEEKLRIEQIKSERLLLNVLPQEIVERLKLSQSKALANKVTETYPNPMLDPTDGHSMLDNLANGISGAIVADAFDAVTVLFADIVNFTEYAAAVSASELVNCLNDIFSEFDRLVDLYDLEKIKTIGDSYRTHLVSYNKRKRG